MEVLRDSLRMHGFIVAAHGLSGGLALLWTKDTDIHLLSYSQRHIDVIVTNDQPEREWRFTGFYGEPDRALRHQSWDLLRQIHGRNNKPWLCAGDFNEILHSNEKLGGLDRTPIMIQNFRTALTATGLHDLGYEGYRFTWCNRRAAPFTTRARLDRACASVDWLDLFPATTVFHEHSRRSDHQVLIINTDIRHSQNRPNSHARKFRFEAHWANCDGVKEMLADLWQQNQGTAVTTGFESKLQGSRELLQKWAHGRDKGLTVRLHKLRKKIESLRTGVISTASKEEENQLTFELETMLDREELYWKQRGKAQWLREGDRNTAYFHKCASERRKANEIHGLRDSTDRWVDSQVEIEGVIQDYFSHIFKSERPSPENTQEALRGIPTLVSVEMNRHLLEAYTSNEVKRALFQMSPLKSPGPDGFSAVFYQKYWEIVGPDVTSFCLNLLNNRVLPISVNFTNVVLIPKCKSPDRMSQFRPISLSNVCFKIASKMIANRLKLFLPHIISETQSAFVPGRLISDNILVAFELNHFIKLKKTGKKGFMTLKLDMSKAYDRVEWSFL